MIKTDYILNKKIFLITHFKVKWRVPKGLIWEGFTDYSEKVCKSMKLIFTKSYVPKVYTDTFYEKLMCIHDHFPF